ncbi:MAG: ABC transporter permease [Propionibacteriaceae bacterium]|nr:ABC transporter permease [Propionibacteriaceae bacterium]
MTTAAPSRPRDAHGVREAADVPTRRRAPGALVGGVPVLALLAAGSRFVGVADVRLADVLGGRADYELIALSRIPRTLSLVLAGAGLSVAGLIMQLLTRNVFVEPSTAGTLDFATLGLLLCALAWPGAPILAKMALGTAVALAGTGLFLRILKVVPLRDVLIVPLVGLMLGGVVGAFSTFIAYRTDLVQSLNSWTTGDFSAVIAGRYELLWITGALVVVAAIVADRFTVAGLGEAFTTNLGLNYRRTMALGMTVVAITSATIVLTVGALPFLGLIVPNVVRAIMGDNARRSVPWVALLGAGLVLACDLIARTVIAPFEMPIATILGIVGAVGFLALLWRGRRV